MKSKKKRLKVRSKAKIEWKIQNVTEEALQLLSDLRKKYAKKIKK